MFLNISKKKEIRTLLLKVDNNQHPATIYIYIELQNKTETNSWKKRTGNHVRQQLQLAYTWILKGMQAQKYALQLKQHAKLWRPHRWIIGPMRPDHALGRLNFLMSFGYGIYYTMIAIFLSDIAKLPATHITLLVAISAIIGTIAGPLWALLADATKQHKLVLRVVQIATAIVVLLQPFANATWMSWTLMIIVYFLGAAFSPITDGLTFVVSQQKGNNDYARVSSYGTLGQGIAAFLIGASITWTGLTIICYAYATLMLVSLAIVRHLPTTGEQKASTTTWSLIKLKPMFSRKLLWFWLVVLLIFGPLQSFNAVFSMLYKDSGGSEAAIGNASFFGLFILWLALRYRQQWYSNRSALTQKLLSYTIIASIGMSWMAIYFLKSSWTFWFAYIVYSAGLALLLTSFSLKVSRLVGNELAGSAISILYAIISLAMFSSTALASLGTKLSGSVLITALLFGLITFAGFALLVYKQLIEVEEKQ
jgi:predicted MFS family arabinose efflux permease